ncbi:hypothetical protein [Brachyspira sp.]|uniref:hypothetical protein n=1 Tax=Brachyspira sp. TaxID=1977261 RepID=UPI003D7EBB8E
MKRIFYIFIFIFVMILSCVSYVETPIVNRDGTYTGNQPTLQKRALQIIISGGGFNMGYVNTNGGTLTTGKSYTVYATNITGVDPNYSFQNSKGAGTLKFVTDNKVIVTFRELIPDYYTIGETVCTKQP